MAAGEWYEAAEHCKALIAEHPTAARAYAYLGWCHAQTGQPVESVEPLRKAIILKPHFWQASFQLAQILDRMGRYDEALQHAREALRDKPGFEPIEALIRGLERQVPEELTDAWQLSVRPMFHTVQLAERAEIEAEFEDEEEEEVFWGSPQFSFGSRLNVKPGTI